MDQFAALIEQLDQTTKTNDKLQALEWYFRNAPHADVVWAVYLLSGHTVKRQITSTQLKEWGAETSGLPFWLFEESYHAVGDLAETIATILSSLPHKANPHSQGNKSLSEWMSEIQSWKLLSEMDRKQTIQTAWNVFSAQERFIFNKLLTGGFRIGVSQKLVTKALATTVNLDENTLAHRIMGDWDPSSTSLKDLIDATDTERAASQPYPFYLAYQLDIPFEQLGQPEEYTAEWKWDGIRGQIIVRHRDLYVWSRGEDLMTDRFPEFQHLRDIVPDGTVLDGEILAWDRENNSPKPFGDLQTRIGRKIVSKPLLESTPVRFMAYDILEWKGIDIRLKPFEYRRDILEQLVQQTNLLYISPLISFTSWQELKQQQLLARSNNAEGLFLKRKSSVYDVGRKRGNWWKWKVDPYTIDAVLIYAQKGHGRRADLYTDYTFAIWDKPMGQPDRKLVSFAKAYSGMTNEEIEQVDAFIKKNTREKFGPVRTVKPQLVFEIAFEGIQKSNRHKSGVAVRFPRISRLRQDKPMEEVDTLETLESLLTVPEKKK